MAEGYSIAQVRAWNAISHAASLSRHQGSPVPIGRRLEVRVSRLLPDELSVPRRRREEWPARRCREHQRRRAAVALVAETVAEEVGATRRKRYPLRRGTPWLERHCGRKDGDDMAVNDVKPSQEKLATATNDECAVSVLLIRLESSRTQSRRSARSLTSLRDSRQILQLRGPRQRGFIGSGCGEEAATSGEEDNKSDDDGGGGRGKQSGDDGEGAGRKSAVDDDLLPTTADAVATAEDNENKVAATPVVASVPKWRRRGPPRHLTPFPPTGRPHHHGTPRRIPDPTSHLPPRSSL